MRIEKEGSLRILYPEEGLLLFKKSDTDRTYHTVIYMAKNDSVDDYAEVTYNFVYGEQHDDTIKKMVEKQEKQDMILELQSQVIDYFIMNNDNHESAMPLPFMSLMAMPSNTKTATVFTKDIKTNPLANYLAMRIKMDKLDYDMVVEKYPELKDKIDRLLK